MEPAPVRPRRVCIFCGSRPGARPAYAAAADALVDACAARGLGVVYGGASVGLMGRVADRALVAGLEVVGVIPQGLVDREVAHRGPVDLRVVATMHERKALMAAESDAFVALPGGIGTYEELFEVFTWSSLGIHRKPLGLLDADGFFAPLAALLDHTVAEGFLDEAVRDRLRHDDDAGELLDELLG